MVCLPDRFDGRHGSRLHGWNETVTIIVATLLYTGVTFLGIRALTIVGIIAAPVYVILGVIALVLIAPSHSLTEVLNYQGQSVGSIMSFGSAVTLVVATVADSGTMTADFTRWAKDGKSAFYATLTAFPFANMFAAVFGIIVVSAGAAVAPQISGGDFMPILTSHGPILLAITLVFVFVNLGSVCTHCLYNGAVGWGRIANKKMRTMTIFLGLLGGVLAAAGVWNLFLDWLNLLGILVPPIGAVIIIDQLLIRHYSAAERAPNYRLSAFLAWAFGAVVAICVHQFVPSFSEAVAGMFAGGLFYYVLSKLTRKTVLERSVAI